MDSLVKQAYEKERIARIRVEEMIKEIERLKRLKPGDPIPGMDKKDSDRFTPNPPIPTRVRSPKGRIGLILEFLGMAQTAGEMGKGAAFLDHRIALRKKAEAELVRLKEALKKAEAKSIEQRAQLDRFRKIEELEKQGKGRSD